VRLIKAIGIRNKIYNNVFFLKLTSAPVFWAFLFIFRFIRADNESVTFIDAIFKELLNERLLTGSVWLYLVEILLPDY